MNLDPLETRFPPHRLVFCAHMMVHFDSEARVQLAATLADACVSSEPEDGHYLREALRLHACAVSHGAPPCAGDHKIHKHMLSSAQVPKYTPEYVATMRSTIASGRASSDTYRMYLHMLVTQAQKALPVVNIAPISPDYATPQTCTNLTTCIHSFAKECTFKVHGDASLHHHIITCMLSPWMSSSMAKHELPYSFVAAAYRDEVNDVLRPVLEETIVSRVAAVSWQSKWVARHLIAVFGLLCELVGHVNIVVLSNASMTRYLDRTDACPLPFVYRNSQGVHVAGYAHKKKLHVAAAEATNTDVVLAWLHACFTHNNGAAGLLAAAIGGFEQDGNPFVRYTQFNATASI